MQRTSINPVSWSVDLGFDAAELIEGHPSGSRFATSLLGVTQLPAQLLVMLEATAVA
jgi:hypothetical protein